MFFFFFFQAEDGIRDLYVTGVQTCALPDRHGGRCGFGPQEDGQALRRRSGRWLSLMAATDRADRGRGSPRRHLRHPNQHTRRASRRCRGGSGLQGSVAGRTQLPVHENHRSRNTADPPLDGTARARPCLFLCMLAYHVEWHLREALVPLLFHDTDLEAARGERTSPVAKTEPSEAAKAKKATKRSADGHRVMSYDALIAHLGT